MPVMTFTAWILPKGYSDIAPVFTNTDSYDLKDRELIIKGGYGTRRLFASCGKKYTDGIPIENNKWSFVAVVYNQVKRTVKLYVNDKMTSSTKSVINQGMDVMFIGSDQYHKKHFRGHIDEVRIYNRELSKIEISALRGKYKIDPETHYVPVYYYEVISNNLIVKTKTDENSKSAGILKKGDTIKNYEQIKNKKGQVNWNWIKIKEENLTGYAQLKYLKRHEYVKELN